MKTKNRFTILLRSTAILAGLFLGACGNMYPELRDYEAVPKIVTAQEYTYGTDAVFPANHAALSNEEETRLANYIQRMAIGKHDRVNLVVYENGEMTPVIEGRIRSIQTILDQQNVQLAGITWSPKITGEDVDRVRVLVDRYLVTLPGCPDWTKSSWGTFDNQVHSNWGCATAMNLGAMMAEPHDLIAGRADNYTDGVYALQSIQRYQTGTTKATEAQATSDSM